MTNMRYNVYHHKRKDVRERKAGAGRPFKLDVKDRFLMLLVYYRSLHNLYASWFLI